MSEWKPLEGGWGYMVAIALSLVYSVSMVPLYAFGLLFAEFLSSTGNATFATALSNCIFNTTLSFTGLAANSLLQKYSCRKVAMLGTIIFFTGSLGIIFTTNLTQFVFLYGIVQGIGFGLLMPACFTSFNQYFMEKKNFVMALCQAAIVSVTLAWPTVTEQLLENYHWKGVQSIFAALSLNCFIAALCLHPIEWHSIRRISPSSSNDGIARGVAGSIPANDPAHEGGLNEREDSIDVMSNDGINKTANAVNTIEDELLLTKQAERKLPHEEASLTKRANSIISIGSVAMPITANDFTFKGNRWRLRQEGTERSLIMKILNLSNLDLFKDWRYLNIAFGLSFSYTSDFMFISMLPLVVTNKGYTNEEATLIMTIYFSFDLICNLFLPILNYLTKIRNRYLFLGGTVLSAVFRIVFVLDDSYVWMCVNVGMLGFLRSFIQTPLPLVIAETYGERFTTAFSLYMVVCGFVTLIYGPLTGLIKFLTDSDELVLHMLTLLYILCATTWTLEMCFVPNKKG